MPENIWEETFVPQLYLYTLNMLVPKFIITSVLDVSEGPFTVEFYMMATEFFKAISNFSH